MPGMIQVPFGPHGQTVSRIAPVGSPGSYKTYSAVMPLATHWRAATCEEAGCDAYALGWVTTVDLSTQDGQRMAHLIAHDKTRRWTLQKVSPTLVKFVFGPGQRCFPSQVTPHRVRVDRPPRFIARDGDFRGNPTGRHLVHKRAEDWIEDQQETLDRVAARRQRG